MKAHDDMERILRQFEPAGPPMAMRQRVLDSALAAQREAAWKPSPFWLAMAAMLVLAIGLHWQSAALAGPTLRAIGTGQASWTEAADEAAGLLGNDAEARRYITLALIAGGSPSNAQISGGIWQ